MSRYEVPADSMLTAKHDHQYLGGSLYFLTFWSMSSDNTGKRMVSRWCGYARDVCSVRCA